MNHILRVLFLVGTIVCVPVIVLADKKNGVLRCEGILQKPTNEHSNTPSLDWRDFSYDRYYETLKKDLNRLTSIFEQRNIRNIFESQAFYDLLEKYPFTIKTLLTQYWYYAPERRASIESFETNFGTERLQMLVDPGVASHLSELEAFLDQQPNRLRGESNYSVRKKFSIHLGEEVCYRAMALTEAEAEKIRKDGIDSKWVKSAGLTTIDYMFGIPSSPPDMAKMPNDNWLGPRAQIFDRVYKNTSSIAIPVSRSRILAASAAYYKGAPLGGHLPEKKLFIFTLQIPRLNLIDYHANHSLMSNIKGSPISIKGYSVGGAMVEAADAELLVAVSIPYNRILSIERYSGIPPEFSIVPGKPSLEYSLAAKTPSVQGEHMARLLAKSEPISDRTKVHGQPSGAFFKGVNRYLMTNTIASSDLPYRVGWHSSQGLPKDYSGFTLPWAPVDEISDVILVSPRGGGSSLVRVASERNDTELRSSEKLMRAPGF